MKPEWSDPICIDDLTPDEEEMYICLRFVRSRTIERFHNEEMQICLSLVRKGYARVLRETPRWVLFVDDREGRTQPDGSVSGVYRSEDKEAAFAYEAESRKLHESDVAYYKNIWEYAR